MPLPAIAFENVTKEYRVSGAAGRIEALADFSLTVPGAGITGLIGPNGSGKSTALKAALGLVRINRGRIVTVGHAAGDRASRKHCGYVPDRGGVSTQGSGGEALTWWGRLNGLGAAETAGRVREVLAQVDLTAVADRSVRAYSKGMVQRLALAQALLPEPAVLLLDEPFAGVDPRGIDLISALLKRLAEAGKTILLSSHLMHRVEALCDMVVLMNRGRVIAAGTAVELIGGPLVKQRGLDDVFCERTSEARPEGRAT